MIHGPFPSEADIYSEQTTCPPSIFRPQYPVKNDIEQLDIGRSRNDQSNDDSKREKERSKVDPNSGSYRISKAKKGKRLHACVYPGCHLVRKLMRCHQIWTFTKLAQVFIRAEHWRRHELSHHWKEQYHCSIVGCGKTFQNTDQLAKHKARQ
jgi:hypothetical protein